MTELTQAPAAPPSDAPARPARRLNALKTITFGDASAVRGNAAVSVATVLLLVLLWFLATYPFAGGPLIKPFFLPSPISVFQRFLTISTDGFRNFTLLEHLWASVYRILMGFGLGCLVGIPVGFAMGLSNVARSVFDPLIELYRPVPPLAFIPLMILWLGIEDSSKITLLFLAAFAIMVIAARAGVANVKLSKVHAAYSLGASRVQVLFHVILPNALPDIFTGMRVAMGVCWGTVVAAEIVAGESGVGFMIMTASKFLQTDTVFLGIIVIGAIGYLIDIVMRRLETRLVPWKGKG